GTASASLVSPMSRAINVASLGWAPSTPSGGVQGPIVIVSDVSPDKLKDTQLFRQKIVLLDANKIFAEGWTKAIPKLDAAWPVFEKAGVLAVIMSDHENNNVLNAHDMLWGAKMLPIPGAEIGMEDGKLIQRMLERGPVTIRLTLDNKVSGETQVNNVIAEIPGSEHQDEWILIGAHLDSWDFGTGAQDNGAGTVSVLEVARAIKMLDRAPRHSIR